MKNSSAPPEDQHPEARALRDDDQLSPAKVITVSAPGEGGATTLEVHAFSPDRLNRKLTVLSILLAGLGSFLFTLASWLVLKQTSLPAFGSSMVTRALATATITLLLAALGTLLWLWIRDERSTHPRWGKTMQTGDRPRWRTLLTYLVAYLSPAGMVIGTLAIPLSATRLYLDGVSVDQGFRTQYLTRLTDSVAVSDMAYADIPSYYPSLWFWLGGRLANLLGMPGWEVFQPWAIISLAVGGSILVPVWQRLIGSLPVATAIAVLTTCVILVMSPDEPYAALVAMGIPAMVAMAPRILKGDLFALVGGILFLGVSAMFYTLFTAVIALSVVALTAVVVSAMRRSWKPIIWLTVLGVASIGLALITWAPYLFASVQGAEQSGDTAMHYLPYEGTQIPLPVLAPSVIGLLCLIGLVYLVINHRDPVVRAMLLSIGVFYGWIVTSMVFTLLGNTLLGFRLDTLIVLMFATAGVLGIADFRLAGVYMLYPERITPHIAKATTTVMIILWVIAGLSYAQSIPERNATAIDLAYTDTDGYGERADLYPPGSAQYYVNIDMHLKNLGFTPAETIVLTDELDFLSFNPYRGFQAFTSHYANPLGEFGKRNAAIEQWATASWTELKQPEDFAAAIDNAEWAGPEVFIFRGDAEDTGPDAGGWKYDLAEDIYPNNPNVRFRGVFFNPEVFTGAGAPWKIEQIGPFVVVTRDE